MDSQLSVQTENLCAIFGGCAKCPGHARAEECGLSKLNPKELVLCTHGCHVIPEKATTQG